MDDQQPIGRAGIYTRVSTDEQTREGYSLDEQERRCKERIEREGWEHVGTFTEAGVSGKLAHRPALDKLLGRTGEIDIVVIHSLDRLGRSTKNLLELYDRFERDGVALVFLREQLDTSTPVGRLLRTLLSAVAEFERDLIVERTSTGIGARARTGKPWGEPSYGYARGLDGHWIQHSGEVPVVRRIFVERVERGLSYNALAALLTREGILTRRGSKWTATVIRRILTEPAVIGQYHHKGTWLQGQHDPIVSDEQWRAAQALADRAPKYAPRGSGRLPKRHVFVRGMLRHAGCEAMLPRSASDAADLYVCRQHKLDSSSCSLPPIRRDVVDAAALSLFEELALDVDGTRAALAASRDQRIATIQQQVDRAARDISVLQRQLDRVERDYRAEELGAAAYTRLSEQIPLELGAAQVEHARLAQQAEDVRQATLALDLEGEALHRLTDLRASVSGRVRSATGIAGLRAAIEAVFSEVWILPAEDPLMEQWDIRASARQTTAGFWLLPLLRKDMIASFDPDTCASALRRVPLALEINQTTSGVPE
jgi:site-specific DNA recombinase